MMPRGERFTAEQITGKLRMAAARPRRNPVRQRGNKGLVGWSGLEDSHGVPEQSCGERSGAGAGFATRNTSETPLAVAGTAWPPRPPPSSPLGLSWASEGADTQDASSTTISAPYKCRFMVVPLNVEVNCCRTAAFSSSQPTDPQHRRTSSRFCCKALFDLPSLFIPRSGSTGQSRRTSESDRIAHQTR